MRTSIYIIFSTQIVQIYRKIFSSLVAYLQSEQNVIHSLQFQHYSTKFSLIILTWYNLGNTVLMLRIAFSLELL